MSFESFSLLLSSVLNTPFSSWFLLLVIAEQSESFRHVFRNVCAVRGTVGKPDFGDLPLSLWLLWRLCGGAIMMRCCVCLQVSPWRSPWPWRPLPPCPDFTSPTLRPRTLLWERSPKSRSVSLPTVCREMFQTAETPFSLLLWCDDCWIWACAALAFSYFHQRLWTKSAKLWQKLWSFTASRCILVVLCRSEQRGPPLL